MMDPISVQNHGKQTTKRANNALTHARRTMLAIVAPWFNFNMLRTDMPKTTRLASKICQQTREEERERDRPNKQTALQNE
jgi:hypothetical protein